MSTAKANAMAAAKAIADLESITFLVDLRDKNNVPRTILLFSLVHLPE